LTDLESILQHTSLNVTKNWFTDIQKRPFYFLQIIAQSFEDEHLKEGATGNSYEDFDHTKTMNLPETFEFLKQIREILDLKTAEDVYNPRYH